jgi:hypothetical protein
LAEVESFLWATTIIAALANGSSTPLATPDWMIVRI